MVTPSGQHHRGGHLPRGIVAAIGERILFGCGIATAWLAGLPRRAGRRLHAATDAEARQWDWQVTERRGGLVHQYRDARFDALRHDPSLRRDELRDDIQPPPAGCPRGGDV